MRRSNFYSGMGRYQSFFIRISSIVALVLLIGLIWSVAFWKHIAHEKGLIQAIDDLAANIGYPVEMSSEQLSVTLTPVADLPEIRKRAR